MFENLYPNIEFVERGVVVNNIKALYRLGWFYDKDKGLKLDKLNVAQLSAYLGSSRTVNVSKDKTTVIDGKGTEEAITKRIEELKEQVENTVSPYEIEILQDRLAKLIGGVAMIHVGGHTEVEMKEKKDRVDDALHATKVWPTNFWVGAQIRFLAGTGVGQEATISSNTITPSRFS